MGNNTVTDRLLMAQDLLEYGGGSYGGGFNSRLHGYTRDERFGYPCAPDRDGEAGFYHAERLINEGKIYYTHRFRHKAYGEICRGYAFPYGGTWVCNSCGHSSLDKPWWVVKVYQDGNAWCCVGLGFLDLQASNNYAFGETKQQALDNYEKIMMEKDQ